jgi:mRNA-degrading endonuclease RelE of RelBE toxin-antitoxin system
MSVPSQLARQRVACRIDEAARTVRVVRIDHRADVYRTR